MELTIGIVCLTFVISFKAFLDYANEQQARADYYSQGGQEEEDTDWWKRSNN